MNNSRQNSVKDGIVLLKAGKNGGKQLKSLQKKVSDRLVELAEIKPGQKVLDIATGI